MATFHSHLTEQQARELICELCAHFYQLGWASGTGGGMSLRKGDHIYMAPSGVQKERLRPEDIFILDLDGNVVEKAAHGLKVSECKPLFLAAYHLRNAGAVLHSHSLNAMLATLIFDHEFEISNLEMMKGIKEVGVFETHKVPIIPNTAHEAELTESLTAAIKDYPKSQAVLVKGHGAYIWGDGWMKAKTQAECYDYLFFRSRTNETVGALMKVFWLEDGLAISEQELVEQGIPYQSIDPRGYQAQLNHWKTERSYTAQDEVQLTPATENLDAILDQFKDEHLHTDDEVRYIVSGSGIFDIRSK